MPIKTEPLEEGGYLATSQVLPAVLAQARSIAETIEIAQDVARKLIESMSSMAIPCQKRYWPKPTKAKRSNCASRFP